MNPRPTAADGQQSLRDHVVTKAREARALSDRPIDRAQIMRLLNERSVVRYPVGVRFDSEPLSQGEFACLEALGSHPSDGFCLFVHPMFELADAELPLLIAYYIPSVNYGEIVSHVEAELYGSTLLDLEIEEYYARICAAADAVETSDKVTPR